jgi:nitrite reductase (NADH) small subunit
MQYRIGAEQEFPAGAWRVVRVLDREVGVYNAGDRLYAVRNRCPHEGARLCVEPLRGTMLPSAPGCYEYGLDGRVLKCPWHGWEFDVTSGERLFGTGGERLRTYELAVECGEVFVEIGREAE